MHVQTESVSTVRLVLDNFRSRELARSKLSSRGNKKQYEALYNEATEKKEVLVKQTQDFYEKVCPFKPKILPQPAKIADKINREDYMERAQQLLEKKAEIEKAKTKIERNNPDIGQKHSRRPPNVQIHEYLYGYTDKQKKELEDLRKSQIKDFNEKAKASKNLESSEKLIWENMDKKLQILFKAFDTDQDGKVTNNDIENVNLEPELRLLMNPLFEEAKIGSIDLGEEEFISACKDLIKVRLLV